MRRGRDGMAADGTDTGMPGGLAGRSALVTGGTGHIGSAVATALAAAGARVVVTGRDPAKGRRVRAALPRGKHDPLHGFVAVEANRPHDFAAALVRIDDQYGPLDVVVHCIGTDWTASLQQTDLRQWQQVMDVNLRSAFLLLRTLLPRLAARRRGSVVMVASAKGVVAHPEDPIYSAAKAGVIRLAQAEALRWAPFGVRVNVVCPGPVTSASPPAWAIARIPLGRAAMPEEVAATVRFLCSLDAAYLTGAVVTVDGGKSAGMWPMAGQKASRDQDQEG